MSKSITKRKAKRAKIKHVLQLGPPEKDCSIACCAMLSGNSYFAAWMEMKFVAPYVERWGAGSEKVCDALECLTARKWHFQRLRKPHPLLADAPWPDVPAMVVIREDGQAKGHMIVYDPSRRVPFINDPSWPKAVPLRKYAAAWEEDGAAMRVVGFIVPVDASNKGA